MLADTKRELSAALGMAFASAFAGAIAPGC
jgi:hypothetical protein